MGDLLNYTPECGKCGVPTDNAKRWPDGYTLCYDCCPPEEWQFEVVYADPPWPESGGGRIKRGADRHYPLMRVSDIAAMGDLMPNGEPGLCDLAAPDSFLFLWATNNYLGDALCVMQAWGYEYKTNIVWCKEGKPGLGFYTRGQHELLLMGVRGSPPRSRQPVGGTRAGLEIPPSVIHAPRGRHSEKPEVFRRIVSAFGQPRLELFARTRSPYFVGWGNEL